MFITADPTTGDYTAPVSALILSAAPGVAPFQKAVTDAETALASARAAKGGARAALDALGGPAGPSGYVKRSDWEAASDAYRLADVATEASARRFVAAARARWEHLYGKGTELGAVHSDAFKRKVTPLYAKASADAAKHYAALVAALEQRAELADLAGVIIAMDGVTVSYPSLALNEVAAYVSAATADAKSAAVDRAVRLANAVLGRAILLPEKHAEITAAISAVLDTPDPVGAVSDVLRRFGLV